MHRTPPVTIQKALRHEVGYGCPVDGCRQAFLTWHHFDPPWRVRQHHHVGGIIALYRPHHDFADSGRFSKEELHALKRRNYSADTAKAQFPWTKTSMLIRLGGCYSGGSSAVLGVSNEPVISLTTGPDGLLLLSFVIRAPDGTVVAGMEENGFQAAPASISDLECNASATRIRLWFAPRDIGIDLSFKRITTDEFVAMLRDDKQLAETSPQAKRLAEEIERVMAQFPTVLTSELHAPKHAPPWIDHLPEHLRELYLSGDPTGFGTKRWASEHCLDDEQKIRLLDFTNISVNVGTRRIRIRNGIVEGQGFIGYSAAFDNAGAFYL